MRNLRSFIAQVLSCLTIACVCHPAHAELDIVFSAQYYQRSGKFYQPSDGSRPQETLQAQGEAHLYRINPNGSKRTRLTFGRQNDYRPLWSPDGTRILFTRYRADGKVAVCTMGAGGGTVSSMLVFPHENRTWDMRYQWSPDGRSVAVTLVWYFREPPEQWLYLVDAASRQTRKVSGVSDCAWSPDSKNVYLSYENGKDKILNLKINRSIPVAAPVWNPVWLDNQNIMGRLRKKELSTPDEWNTLRILSSQGKQRRQVRLRSVSKPQNDDSDSLELYPAASTWRRLRKNSPFLLLEQSWGMSDGRHHDCYLVNYKSGKWRFLRDGMALGLSPDRKFFAVANHEWVGPYKQGGQRVGALEIVSLKSGKARAITSRLVSINGGDWRSAKGQQQ